MSYQAGDKSTGRVQALSGYFRVCTECSSLPEPVPVLSYVPLHANSQNTKGQTCTALFAQLLDTYVVLSPSLQGFS